MFKLQLIFEKMDHITDEIQKFFEENKKSDANIHQMQEDLHYMDTKINEKEANIKRTLNEAKIILEQKKREEEMTACEVNEHQKKLSELEKAELLSNKVHL